MTVAIVVAIWIALALVAGALWAIAGWLWGRRGTRGGGSESAVILRPARQVRPIGRGATHEAERPLFQPRLAHVAPERDPTAKPLEA